MTKYYKIVNEREISDKFIPLTVLVRNYSIVPENLHYEVLTSEQLDSLGNEPREGLYYTREDVAVMDAIVDKIQKVEDNPEVYIEYAFQDIE
ncbi:gp49 [Listeria phage P40]|uniref:gp49 n=1 Tax=Listeria phage P40 TaxID=560178 RepID=UPI00018198FE|nr:gp49 [Listeria phage P40]ACI00409.1 gp49 [Listeria phage P40]